jgi:hypothetical protein
VYARNHCLMPGNSSARLKSDGYGPGVQRVTIAAKWRWSTPKPVRVSGGEATVKACGVGVAMLPG